MSPQSQLAYKALLKAKIPLSANDLGLQLGIVPNSIYRLVTPLIDMGLVKKTDQTPSFFSTNSIDQALSSFLIYQSNWFSHHFSSSKSNSSPISFSFIQSRDELMNLSIEEVNKSTRSIDLLRSGREFPADLLLAMVRAKSRGVPTRMLIQDYSKQNVNLVSLWEKNGILVRKTPLRNIRLMLYDSKSLYFMSYLHDDSEKDLGLKINYPPFATILSQQFNQWWKDADRI